MGKSLKRGLSVFLVLLMAFSSIPLTESFAQQITDFGVSNLLSLNASATDIPAASTSNTVSNLQSVNIINSDDSIANEEESKEEGLKRSDINYMSSGISTFNLTSQVSDYSSNPNTYTVLLLDIEAAHNMESGGQYLCTLGSPIEQVKAAALKLIEQIKLTRGTTNVAIVTFCSTVKVVQNFTDDYTTMSQAINNISANGAWANINGALKKADELLSTISDTNVDKNIVLFSQGLAYAGDYSSTGRYSQSDCGWHRLDNNIYAYQYANSAYTTAENLKSKYNLYSVGLYQSFDVVPEEGQDLLSFAKRFNNDIQNKGYYDITSIDDLEFSFAQDVFNLGVAIDPDKIIIPVRAIDTSGDLVPIEGAEVTIYLGSEAKDTKRSESDGYVVFSKNELYQKGVSVESLNNCTVSAHYNVGNVILCSEDIYTNGTWAGEKLMSGYSLICDEPRQYVDLTVAYSSSIKQSKIEKLMSNYAKDLAQMTNGHILLSGYSLIQVNSDAELPSTNADVKVYKKLNGVARSNGSYKSGGRIEIDDGDNSATLCHESGHLLFGFLDEYKAAGKDGSVTDYKMSPLWSNLKSYTSNNGYVVRPDQAPSLFGVMERQQKTLEMSNSNDYFYVELLEGSKESQPEAYTWQYYYNGTSTEGQLMGNFERAVNSYGYSINYTDTMGSPMTTEYWFAELSDGNSITPIEYQYDVCFDAEITNEELADIEFSYLNDNLLIKTNNSNILCYTYLDGVVSEVTFETDGDYCNTELDLSNTNVLTFVVVQEIDSKYFKNEYVIEKYDSMYDAFSAEQHLFYSNDENLNTVIQISSNIYQEQDEYHSVSEKQYVLCDSTFGVINENISYIPNVNYDSLQWLYTDIKGVSSFLNTTITVGESNSINASCAFAGVGTYVLMSSNVSAKLDVSPSIINVSTANCLYDGQIEIDLETLSDEVPVFYKLYHSKNSVITSELLATMEYEVFNYDDSIFVDLSDGYGKYYFAVTAVFSDGSESALSNVFSYDVVAKDSDMDGIPDYWVEKYYQIEEVDDIANADPDDDGLDNLTEYEYGTNPLNPDTDGDNVYDKIELLKDLDPLNPITDGKTDDYIVAYGIPELEICEVSFDEDFIYFSIKNDTDGKAMRTLVDATIEDEPIAMWSVNIDERSIVQFALDRTAVEDWNGLTIEVDSVKLVRDSDYSNNIFTYSAATGISLADMDVVKGTKQQAAIDTTPAESNEIYSWELVEGNCISIDESSGEITANKIGQASVSVETLSGLTDECLVSVVAFEGAEYSEFDSKLINNNTEVAIIGYIGDDSSIVIPETIGSLPVTQLSSYAFEDCTFKEATIHSGINSIANTTFSDTTSLERIVVDEANTSYCSVDGILYSSDKTQLIKYPSAKNVTTFTIPEKVTTVTAYALCDCDFIESITISENVESMGNCAISDCDNLQTVYYNAVDCSVQTSSLIASLYATFKYSDNIQTVVIGDQVKYIPGYLFYDCSDLKEVIFGENPSLLEIGTRAFYYCSDLENFEIPDTVEWIGSSAFYKCSKLNGIVLPEALTSIGTSAFAGCSSLTSIVIPETVTSISDNTFANCTALEKIEIPYQTITIGETPFNGCSKVVIWCYNNSVAYEYAVANSIKYKIMDLDADDLVVTGIEEKIIDSLQYQLSAEIAPIYTNEQIVWSSSDSKVFTVSNTGLLTAKGAGEAILTVSSSRGSVSKTFNINVLGLSKDSENANLYHVRNADDMITLSTMVNNGVSFAGKIIQLDNDVDLSNVAWTPIGIDSTNVFSGVFDGNNHTITGLNYSTTSNTYSGLFGDIKTGGVKDLTVEGSVNGISRVGMIAGCIFDSALYNCKAIGEVKRIGSGSYGYVGGLVGSALHSVIINCAAETDITTDFGDSIIDYAAVGGIVGTASTAGSDPMCILNSYCIGDISVNGNSYDSSYENYYVGGIAGYLKDDAANNYYFGEITNADEDPIKKIGYTFGYVVPEYTSESDYNGIGTIIVQDNYYLEGKNAIGKIATGDYDTTDWTTSVTEESFSKLIGEGSLVDELNGNKGSVEDIIVAHRDILSNSTWAELVDRINGDSFTVSSWKIGSNNLPVNYECDCYRHAESEWIIDVEATCTKEGSKHTYCLVCQETVTTSIIEKVEHKFSDWTETKAATCTEKGSEYRTCTTCNSATETRDIAELGHNFVGEWTTDIAPTCTKSGVESRICTRCKSEKETRTVDKLGHDFESKWTVDKEATCSKVGSKSHHCSRCDEKSDVTVINKIAHSYRESVQEATCIKDGKKTYNCSACGDSFSEVITAKGHIDQNGDGKCDNCDYIYDNTCDHMCHKSGFMGLIWKIVRFFWKLFKMNPICECGVAHY